MSRGTMPSRLPVVVLLACVAAPISWAQITDIAVVREDLSGDTLPDHMGESFTIQGVVNSPWYTPNRLDFHMQDATGGININTTPGDWTVPAGVEIGAEIEVTGVVTQYNGKAELDPVFLPDNITVLNPTAGDPTPLTRTIADILASAESYEGVLLRVENATFAGPLPCAGQSVNVNLTDSTGTMVFRVDSDTDLGGMPSYFTEVDVVGVFSQFDSSLPYDSGYQLLARMYADIAQVGIANNAPTLDCFLDDPLIVNVGSTGTAVAVALDADAIDDVSLVASNLPANATFDDNGDRTATLTFAPDAAQYGQTYAVTITADDGLETGSRGIDLDVPAEVSPYAGLFVINEVMADPHPASPPDVPNGDWNNDGVRDAEDDEFVEIVYVGAASFDAAGFTIHDAFGPRHVAPAATILEPDQAWLVFGGPTPTGSFGGALVQTATSGMLGLSNNGDTVTLFDDMGRTVATMTFGAEGAQDQSLTLDPDVTGADYVQHSAATGSGGTLGSPGTRVDGTPFTANKPPRINTIGDQAVEVGSTLVVEVATTEPDGDTITMPDPARPANTTYVDNGNGTATFTFTPDGSQANQTYTVVFRAEDKDGFDEESVAIDVLAAGAYEALVINEILYDPHPDNPPSDPNGDANNDGVRDGSEDEFIEIVNTGANPIGMSGMVLRDAVTIRHIFPAGTKLQAGQAVVVFGGDTPTGAFGGSVVQTASTGFLGLNNNGDTVTLLKPDDATIVEQVIYVGDSEVADQSINLDPELTGTVFVAHSSMAGSGGTVHSPGTRVDGTPFVSAAGPFEIVSIEPVAGTTLRIAFTAEEGATYAVESAPRPDSTLWTQEAAGIVGGAGGTASGDVDAAGLGESYYRAVKTD